MIEQVKLFMEVMGQDLPPTPTIPSKNIQQLRFSLIDEENKELADAAAAGDIVEVADALCDSLYVIFGACLAYGFSPELVQELFAEVQASNMSKVCQTKEEALATIEKYVNEGISTQSKKVGDFFVISRISDNKVLKSVNWKEPDLKTILAKYGCN